MLSIISLYSHDCIITLPVGRVATGVATLVLRYSRFPSHLRVNNSTRKLAEIGSAVALDNHYEDRG